jgi:hypothetical protein
MVKHNLWCSLLNRGHACARPGSGDIQEFDAQGKFLADIIIQGDDPPLL